MPDRWVNVRGALKELRTSPESADSVPPPHEDVGGPTLQKVNHKII